MKVYIVVDYEDLESIQVFSNKSDAEDYMLNYIFKYYTEEEMGTREEVKAYIQDSGCFESVYLIEREIITE